MRFPLRPGLIFASLAAIIALLCAWFLPWHDIISGEEQLAPQQMPQTRQTVQQARDEFSKAAASYQSYIKNHDLSALLDRSKTALAAAKADPTNVDKLAAVRQIASEVQDYALQLESYSSASDKFLSSLQGYDDTLMSWTRGLFSASESLRSQTWPFVEHLKLYPQPIGLKTDPPVVTHEQVAAQISSLQAHVAALNPDPDPHGVGTTPAQSIDGLSNDVSQIWGSGRSVEYVAGLNSDYGYELAAYDSQVQQAAADPAAAQAPTKGVSAWALTLLVGVVTLGGLMALFTPKTETAT